MDSNICIICNKEAENPIYVTTKGADSINVASSLRNTDIFAQSGSAVHLDCRKRYIDKKDVKSNKRKSSITATEEQGLLPSSRRPLLHTEE